MRRIEEYWVIFDDEAQEEPKGFVSALFDGVDSVRNAILAVFVIFTFVFRAVGVDGSSMVPTLHDGDWMAVRSIVTEVKRGDIVIITQPWDRNVPIVKRVIAVSGDVVNIDFNLHEVYVNGEKLNEPYINEPTALSYDMQFPLTVDEGKVFVMGDNRNDSLDSRSSRIGLIDERYIFGKAEVRLHPIKDWNIYKVTAD